LVFICRLTKLVHLETIYKPYQSPIMNRVKLVDDEDPGDKEQTRRSGTVGLRLIFQVMFMVMLVLVIVVTQTNKPVKPVVNGLMPVETESSVAIQERARKRHELEKNI
jgi:hypothetical protein